jgi:hypothetical protein
MVCKRQHFMQLQAMLLPHCACHWSKSCTGCTYGINAWGCWSCTLRRMLLMLQALSAFLLHRFNPCDSCATGTWTGTCCEGGWTGTCCEGGCDCSAPQSCDRVRHSHAGSHQVQLGKLFLQCSKHAMACLLSRNLCMWALRQHMKRN